MPDNFDEWFRLICYISSAVGLGVVLYGMRGLANTYWDAQFYKDENDEDE